MNTYELLRKCADTLERAEGNPSLQGFVLNQPHYTGRFPFAGGGTELLSATTTGTNYYVPVYRVLGGLAKALKEQEKTEKEARST